MSDATTEELLSHRDWLTDLVRRLVADPGTADDVVQEACLTALRRPPPHRRGLKGWFATVARNLVTDERRRRTRTERRDRRASSPETAPDTADVVAKVEAERQVAKLVLAMPEPYRSTLLLRYWRGLSPKAIARETGTPSGTVRSRLSRAHEMLRERLDRRHRGDRGRWLAALLPILTTRTAEAKGVAAMSLSLKFAAVVLIVASGGVATSLLFAETPQDSPSVVAPVVAQVAVEEPKAPAKEREEEKKKPESDPLDRKTSLEFDEVPIRDALGFLTDVHGVRFDIRGDSRDATITLSANGITLRAAIDLICISTGHRWKERADGTIEVSPGPDPEKPAPKKTEPEPEVEVEKKPPPDPIYPARPPEIVLRESKDAKPLPGRVANEALEIVMAKDGKRYIRLRPAGRFECPPTRFALWLRLSDLYAAAPNPDATPTLFRVDREVKKKQVLKILSLLNALGRPVGPHWFAVTGPTNEPTGVLEFEGYESPAVPTLPKWVRSMFSGRDGHRNLRAHGGSADTQSAVDIGLRKLAEAQQADGSWATDEHGIATTAGVLLAFLGAGETPKHGHYKENLRTALDWLVDRQRPDGSIGAEESRYAHPIATVALAEMYAVSRSAAEWRGPAQRAVDWLEARDESIERTHALSIARIAGLRVDVMRLTESVRAIGSDTPIETAVGALDRMFLGEAAKSSEEVSKRVRVLRESRPSVKTIEGLIFTWIATDAVLQAGIREMRDWNAAMKAALLPLPRHDTVRDLAAKVLTLQTYYRYGRIERFNAR